MCISFPTDITLCLWSGFIFPRIRTFVEKRFYDLFSKKEGFEIWRCSFVSELKPRSTSSAEKFFPDEITWITWKTKQNLEIWLFLNSRLEMWVWESGRKIGPATGVTPPPPNVIYSRFWYAFFMLKLAKYPPPYGGGLSFYFRSHDMNRFARNGPNLAENRIGYDLKLINSFRHIHPSVSQKFQMVRVL